MRSRKYSTFTSAERGHRSNSKAQISDGTLTVPRPTWWFFVIVHIELECTVGTLKALIRARKLSIYSTRIIKPSSELETSKVDSGGLRQEGWTSRLKYSQPQLMCIIQVECDFLNKKGFSRQTHFAAGRWEFESRTSGSVAIKN